MQVQARLVSDDPYAVPSLRSVVFSEEPIVTNMSEASGDERSIPDQCALFQNYPNPFNASTAIRYELPFAGRVTLHIYDLMGQRIRTLVDEMKPAGSDRVVWNGKDDGGREVSSGMYLYRLEAGKRNAVFVDARRMILLR